MRYSKTMYSKIITSAHRIATNSTTLCDSCCPTMVTSDCTNCPICTLIDVPSTLASCTRIGMIKRVVL